MATHQPGRYRVNFYCSLENSNNVRVVGLTNALRSVFPPSGGVASARLASDATPNPNVTVSQERNCGRWAVRAAFVLILSAPTEDIDIIRDCIRALGQSGATNVRNDTLETVWSTGRQNSSTVCTTQLTRGSFSVVRATAPTATRPAPAGTPPTASGAPPRVPVPEPVAAVPVPIADRVASGGETVRDATVTSNVGKQQAILEMSTIADTLRNATTEVGGTNALLIGVLVAAAVVGVVLIATSKKKGK